MSYKLTGKRRHRIMKCLFGDPKLVLQVQVKGLVSSYVGGIVSHDNEIWWIDADVIHLTVEDDES